MNVFQRAGSLLDFLWSAIDPDEPLFCDCQGAWTCSDCALGGSVEPAADWPAGRAAAPPLPAA